MSELRQVTIGSLIFRSMDYARFLWGSVEKHTPLLQLENVNFLFLANDATEEVLDGLCDEHIPHEVHHNEDWDAAEMERRKIGWPFHLSRVYRGFNRMLEIADLGNDDDVFVLLNSDHYVGPGWLEPLLGMVDPGILASSALVEGRRKAFPHPSTIRHNFGQDPLTFNEEGFLGAHKSMRRREVWANGPLSPMAMYVKTIRDAGGYPPGNTRRRDNQPALPGNQIAGDVFLRRKLHARGIRHHTSGLSVVYHIGEGEFLEGEKRGECHRDR